MKGKLKNKRIILGVTGGIAAYKACELVRRLAKLGADVHVVMTKAAGEFVTPLTFQTLSRNRVSADMFALPEEMTVSHISLADRAELLVIAPASANILAKVACGICDDLLTTVILATKAPVVFAPSMNVNMWNNLITRENVKRLKDFGYRIIEPDAGELACGYDGKGRLADVDCLVDYVVGILSASKPRGRKR